ncbi:ATP-binding protein [Aurantibacter sp.]|uniref:Dph6-related ATP pyrophosphatase n=1 Tax=Aurantibacter sp. TaxID=2807103 RepID=UPI0035C821E2
MQPHKTYFNWSSGKDSSFALFLILKDSNYNVDLLVTTINKHYNRVSMHGLRRNVLEAQTKALNLPLKTIELPELPSMEDYEAIMTKTINDLITANYTHCVFGDIFLEDLRTYRDNSLKPFNLTSIYPLWKMDTKKLITQFIDLGFKAVVVCAKADFFDEDFVGKTLTHQLIEDLPKDVDVCGENGEFHTFCYDGPIFSSPVNYNLGEKTYRAYNTPNTKDGKSGFWFCDIILD